MHRFELPTSQKLPVGMLNTNPLKMDLGMRCGRDLQKTAELEMQFLKYLEQLFVKNFQKLTADALDLFR